MTDIRVLWTTKKVGAIPKDRFVNTWHFTGTDSAATMAAQAKVLLHAFYAQVPSGAAVAVGAYMAPYLSRAFGDTTFQAYDLADPEPRVPILTAGEQIAPASGATSSLPNEVAICLSYQAARISGLPQARRRGRVYIGPLGNGAAAGGTTVAATLDPTFNLVLRSAALAMRVAGTAGTSWGVRSRVGSVTRVVTDGWVDDAFDTQRRRGLGPSVRNTW